MITKTDEELQNICEKTWKSLNAWKLTLNELVERANFKEKPSYGNLEEVPHAVYVSPEGYRMTLSQYYDFRSAWSSFESTFKLAWRMAEKETV